MGSNTKTNSAFLEKPIPSFCPAGLDVAASLSLPENIDMDVFSQLPEDIKKEIIQSPQSTIRSKNIQTNCPAAATRGIQSFFVRAKTGHQVSSTRDDRGPQDSLASPVKEPLRKDFARCASGSALAPSCTLDSAACLQDTEPSVGLAMDRSESGDSGAEGSLPKSIDMNVFSQLPTELQKELMSEWKNQKLTPKIQTKKLQDKVKTSKGQRPSAASRPNNLLKYFKPS